MCASYFFCLRFFRFLFRFNYLFHAVKMSSTLLLGKSWMETIAVGSSPLRSSLTFILKLFGWLSSNQTRRSWIQLLFHQVKYVCYTKLLFLIFIIWLFLTGSNFSTENNIVVSNCYSQINTAQQIINACVFTGKTQHSAKSLEKFCIEQGISGWGSGLSVSLDSYRSLVYRYFFREMDNIFASSTRLKAESKHFSSDRQQHSRGWFNVHPEVARFA